MPVPDCITREKNNKYYSEYLMILNYIHEAISHKAFEYGKNLVANNPNILLPLPEWKSMENITSALIKTCFTVSKNMKRNIEVSCVDKKILYSFPLDGVGGKILECIDCKIPNSQRFFQELSLFGLCKLIKV